MKVDNISCSCLCSILLSKEKLDHKYATIILYYYCDQPSSFSQAPSACGVQCSTERLANAVTSAYLLIRSYVERNNFKKAVKGHGIIPVRLSFSLSYNSDTD